MTDTSQFTRIDLAKEGEWVVIRAWKQGWKEGDEPAFQDSIEGSLFYTLTAYENRD